MFQRLLLAAAAAATMALAPTLPAAAAPGVTLARADIQRLSAYAQACAETRACREETPDLAATVLAVLSRPDFTWRGQRIDMSRVRAAAEIELRDPATAYRLFAALVAADQGDPSGLATLAAPRAVTSPGSPAPERITIADR
jgi:hypothetical protein